MACVSGLHAPRDGTGVLLQHWNHRTRSMAYLQRYNVALMSFAARSVRGRGVVGDGTGMRGSRLHGNDGGNRCYTADGGAIPGMERPSGVRRGGKLLIRFRLVPFRSISNRLREQGMRGPAFGELYITPRPHLQRPHPMLRIDLSSGMAGSGETFNSVAFSCIWLHFLSSMPAMGAGDARFPPSRERRLDSLQRRM